jgi:hypothetical protein
VFASDRPIKDNPLPGSSTTRRPQSSWPLPVNWPDPFGALAIEIWHAPACESELLGLTTDAVVQIGSAYWLRVPLGKLHNDRLHSAASAAEDHDRQLLPTARLAGQPAAVH